MNGDGAVGHLNEVSWVEDLNVSNLNVASCWLDGQCAAETVPTAHGMPINFTNLGGVDMLRPIDGTRYPGVGSSQDIDRSFAEKVIHDRHEEMGKEGEATEGGDEAEIDIAAMLDENGSNDDESTRKVGSVLLTLKRSQSTSP